MPPPPGLPSALNAKAGRAGGALPRPQTRNHIGTRQNRSGFTASLEESGCAVLTTTGQGSAGRRTKKWLRRVLRERQRPWQDGL